MKPLMKQTLMWSWLPLFVWGLPGLASAAPDYVTAWPRQVAVDRPDPVLGDKPFGEHWVYSETFARRFKGFPIKEADSELKGGIQAMVLRIFKMNFWQELNPDYPEQYACEIDVYFDNRLSLPPTESRAPYKARAPYPKGISASYQRLQANDEGDQGAIREPQSMRAHMKKQPVIFPHPFDGRFSQFGVRKYYPSLVPGLSVITLLSGFNCEVTAPLPSGGGHWLSLLGERPWDKREGGPPKAIHGLYQRDISPAFEPGPDPTSQGYFRVPEAFSKAALPKAALVKVLNWCIHQERYQSDWKVSGRTITVREILQRCEEAKQHGQILPDPRYYPNKDGLQDTGY